MEVHYVHGIIVDSNDPILRKITEFCNSNDVSVTVRIYNGIERSEDKENIARLPAIQVYTNNEYDQTIYPNFKPVQLLMLALEKYQLRELEHESKKQIWDEKINYLKSVFRSLKTDSKRANQT